MGADGESNPRSGARRPRLFPNRGVGGLPAYLAYPSYCGRVGRPRCVTGPVCLVALGVLGALIVSSCDYSLVITPK